MKQRKTRLIAAAAAAAATVQTEAFTQIQLSSREERTILNPSSSSIFRRTAKDNSDSSTVVMKSSAFDNATPNDQVLQEEYSKWRLKYNKGDFDAVRFENFKTNFMAVTVRNNMERTRARLNGEAMPSPIALNEFGDCSSDEYRTQQFGGYADANMGSANRRNNYNNNYGNYNNDYGNNYGNNYNSNYNNNSNRQRQGMINPSDIIDTTSSSSNRRTVVPRNNNNNNYNNYSNDNNSINRQPQGLNPSNIILNATPSSSTTVVRKRNNNVSRVNRAELANASPQLRQVMQHRMDMEDELAAMKNVLEEKQKELEKATKEEQEFQERLALREEQKRLLNERLNYGWADEQGGSNQWGSNQNYY